MRIQLHISAFVFFIATAPTEIYTLSLHDALPISSAVRLHHSMRFALSRITTPSGSACTARRMRARDRKSTRLNSSHGYISYAVFCLKKKTRVIRFLHLPTPVSNFRLVIKTFDELL